MGVAAAIGRIEPAEQGLALVFEKMAVGSDGKSYSFAKIGSGFVEDAAEFQGKRLVCVFMD